MKIRSVIDKIKIVKVMREIFPDGDVVHEYELELVRLGLISPNPIIDYEIRFGLITPIT